MANRIKISIIMFALVLGIPQANAAWRCFSFLTSLLSKRKAGTTSAAATSSSAEVASIPAAKAAPAPKPKAPPEVNPHAAELDPFIQLHPELRDIVLGRYFHNYFDMLTLSPDHLDEVQVQRQSQNLLLADGRVVTLLDVRPKGGVQIEASIIEHRGSQKVESSIDGTSLVGAQKLDSFNSFQQLPQKIQSKLVDNATGAGTFLRDRKGGEKSVPFKGTNTYVHVTGYQLIDGQIYLSGKLIGQAGKDSHVIVRPEELDFTKHSRSRFNAGDLNRLAHSGDPVAEVNPNIFKALDNHHSTLDVLQSRMIEVSTKSQSKNSLKFAGYLQVQGLSNYLHVDKEGFFILIKNEGNSDSTKIYLKDIESVQSL